MTTQGLTNCYRVHLTRIDGAPIDTKTGTLTYDHTYLRRNGKPFSQAVVERKFNKSMNWKGYEVSDIEVFQFDPEA